MIMKKDMRTKLLSFLLACTLLGFLNHPVTSMAAKNVPAAACAEYDMNSGGTQEFDLLDKTGQSIHVTVAEEPSGPRLKNRTYSVSYESPLSWRAGYKVVIRNNAITSVHSPWCKPLIGSITSRRLIKNGSTRATYYLTRKVLTSFYRVGVRTTVSKTSLKVTAI